MLLVLVGLVDGAFLKEKLVALDEECVEPHVEHLLLALLSIKRARKTVTQTPVAFLWRNSTLTSSQRGTG